jgi:putative glycosyltransferase (TIGR04372 family)
MLTNRFLIRIRDKVEDKGLIYTLWHGVKKLLSPQTLLIVYPLAFVLCLVVRIIKPLLFIRFGSLYCEKIGPFAAQTELYLCEKEHGNQPGNTLDIFYSGMEDFKCCNYQLLKMWKRLFVFNETSKYLYRVMVKLPFGKDHIIKTTNDSRDIHGLLEKSDVHLEFLPEEITQAKLELSRIGIGKGDKYVLMINRGQRYLDTILPGHDEDLSCHTHRNCSINDFMPMAEMLTSKGNYVIRVGHLVSDLMETENPKIIEYDEDGFRTELLDIYLGANCRYLVGSDTGYFGVPGWIFHRPVIYVNFSEFEYLQPWLSSWLLIFRKYWLKSEKRFMTVREIIESGAGRLKRTKEIENMGIEKVVNTPEEICDVVDEMEKRLAGSWQDNVEDDELQRRFWSYFKSSALRGVIRGRIGSKFLRDNRELLC